MAVAVQQQERNGVHPHKLLMWLGIAGFIMLFAALTSAYVVKRGAANWVDIPMPKMFWATSCIIILSSISLHWSIINFRKAKYNAYKLGLLVTFILGTLFIIGQYMGWMELRNMGLYIDGTSAASFLYAISMVHGVHVLGGVIALAVILFRALRVKYNPANVTGIEVASIYWHFVDILWIYLFVLLQLKI